MTIRFAWVSDGLEIEDPAWGGMTLSPSETQRLHKYLDKLEREGKI